MDIEILKDFKDLIPPLTNEEKNQLEKNIVADGCRDPLVIWNGTLIDGHNRYEICKRLKIDFRVEPMKFNNISEVKEWIIKTQFGRRNLSAYDRSKLALALESEIAKRAKVNQVERKGKQAGASLQNSAKLDSLDTRNELATIAGVSHDTIAKVKLIEQKATSEIKQQLAKQEISINAAHLQITRNEKENKREIRRCENYEKTVGVKTLSKTFENGAKFATIVVDPPWDWGDENEGGGGGQFGRAKPDYATIKIEQLLELPVAVLADIDCHIYLWITNRSLPKGFLLLEKWGFRYITSITWVKPSFGMGTYFRGQTEHVLFGVKGSQPLKRKDASTVFYAERGKGGHSSKPLEFQTFVESCSPGPYLEMFSRSKERPNWTAWGENNV